MASRTVLVTDTRKDDLPSRSLWQQLSDAFFGYDFFISYAHSDGAIYARSLAQFLVQHGFECFLDTEAYAKGDDWQTVGNWALKRTSRLVLIKTRNALASRAVLREVLIFTSEGKRIIPIEFSGQLTPDEDSKNPLLQLIREPILRITECGERLQSGPSPDAIQELVKSFDITRQSVKRTRWLQGFVSALVLLLLAASWQWYRALSAERDANASLLNSFFDQGETYLVDNPGYAMNLGFQLANLGDAQRSIDLVLKALPRIPVWRVVSEPMREEDKWSSRDLSFATDPEIKWLLTERLEDDNNTTRYSLALRDLTKDQLAATTTLEPGERLVRSDPQTTRLFATLQGPDTSKTLRLRELSSTGFGAVALEVHNVHLFTCTNGDWPCYVITSNGTLCRYASPSQGGLRSTAIIDKLPFIWAVYAHPTGGSLALVGNGQITWLGLKQDGSLDRKRVFNKLLQPRVHEASDSVIDDGKRGDSKEDIRFRWGPEPDEFLVASKHPRRAAGKQRVSGAWHLSITAVMVPTRSKPSFRRGPSTVLLYEGDIPLISWVFETALGGRRVAVSEMGDSLDEEVFHILDVEWGVIRQGRQVGVAEHHWTVRGTPEHPLMENYPATFAPSGNYLVTSAFTFRRSERFAYDITGDYGRLLSWSTPDIEDDFDPVAVEIPSDHKQIAQLLYSRDSKRILALDDDRIFRIFNVKVDSSDLEADRSPEEWRRFEPKVIPFGAAFRYLLVRYSDTDLRYYDQHNGSEVELRARLASQPVLAAEIGDGITDVTVVTPRTLVRLIGGEVKKSVPLLNTADDADVQSDITTVRIGGRLFFYDTTSLSLIGDISVPMGDTAAIGSALRFSAMRLRSNCLVAYGGTRDDEYAWTVCPSVAGNMRVQHQLRLISGRVDRLAPGTIIRAGIHGGGPFVLDVSSAEDDDDRYIATMPRLIDLTGGDAIPLAVPKTGWPKDVGAVEYVSATNNGHLLVMLEQRSTSHGKYVVEWDDVTAGPVTIRAIKLPRDRIVASYMTSDKRVAYLLCADEFEHGFSLLRLPDGKELWQARDDDTYVPPLMNFDCEGQVRFRNVESHRKTRTRILLGGLDNPMSVSHVPLPSGVQRDLDSLRSRMRRWPWQ